MVADRPLDNEQTLKIQKIWIKLMALHFAKTNDLALACLWPYKVLPISFEAADPRLDL